ncbi:hypothetical protein M5689_020708 [Euphorbia peplus]|nr:hypothetical protein M5689_020708 [Euphorbia peplus]
MIEEKLASREENQEFEEILRERSSHGRPWLVGRVGHIKKKKKSVKSSAGTSKKNISDEAIEEIKAVVKEEMRNEVIEEVREEMEKTMHTQLVNIIQRLAQMNPTLNLNLYGVVSSSDTTDSLSLDTC